MVDEKEKEASLFSPHCPSRKSSFLIASLSLLNLLMTLPVLPSDRFRTFHPNHGESSISPDLSAAPCWVCVSETSFGLLPKSLMLVYCSLQVPCGTQASLYEVCSLPDYTLDNKTHTHSVLLFLEPIPISLLCWPWPLGPDCSFPYTLGSLASLKREKMF